MTRRVVITGVGIVTAFGDLEQTRTAIRERRSALAPVQSFDAAPFGESRAGECHSFDPLPWFRQPKALKVADRRTRLAMAAAGMALADAQVDPALLESAGVVIGTSGSDVQAESCGIAVGSPQDGDVTDTNYFGTRILRRLNPLWLLVNLANMASGHIAIQFEARGPNSTISTDWIAGLQAIGEASRWIYEGEADLVIAGGADCGVLPFAYACLEESGFFSNDDPSFVPAEGAALYVLEELEHARARGARILGELGGYAASASENAMATTMRRAMEQSDTSEIDLLCDAAVHVSQHRQAEERAIAKTFPTTPPRFECTSLLGHAFAAAAPSSLAIALAENPPGRTLLVNAMGVMQQAASLVVRTGVADEGH
jgi:3-oxoacyl-[acyl-carrier-protein] synthase II